MNEQDIQRIEQARSLKSDEWSIAYDLEEQAESEEARNELHTIRTRLFLRSERDDI